MENLILFFILIPITGFVASLIAPAKNERLISFIAFGTTGLTLISITCFTIIWMFNGAPSININEINLYSAHGYDFFIDLYFDKVTAVYLLFSSVLAYLIAVYSRYYMHRESGFKRFFNTKLLFITGINTIVLSGNFETLFIGWEILGLSSFLLIAYYRERYLPVKNGLKIYSIYRVADVGLLLAMWLSHHLWHENITFLQLNDAAMVNSHLHEHYFVGLIISLTIVMAAAAKSAQFPFSSWLPRAMEGPTPSSAIFYGSVAVHIGVFLLLRTYPFWSGQIEIKILVISIGIITAVLSSITAKVMSTVKAQIAYSSTAQIGLIFIEVALGWDNIALIHLSGNAFLRAYQLLISPSIVTYLIREQFFNFKPKTISQSSSRFKNSLYIIAMNEFKLDDFMYKILWTPLKKIGNFARFMNLKITVISTIALFIGSIILLNNNTQELNLSRFFIPEFIGFIAVIILLRSFVERKNAFKAWNYIFISHCWIVIAIGFNESFNLTDTLFYFGGIVPAFIFGLYFLKKLKTKETFDLNDFYGHSFEHKWLAFGFLLSSLALIGFPITTTFLGEDLLFTHIKEDQFFIATCVSVCYIVEGIAAIRIYSRIFLGPHKKSYHPVPLRDA